MPPVRASPTSREWGDAGGPGHDKAMRDSWRMTGHGARIATDRSDVMAATDSACWCAAGCRHCCKGCTAARAHLLHRAGVLNRMVNAGGVGVVEG